MAKRYSLKKIIKSMFRYELFPYQLKLLHACIHNKRVVAAYCRQTGKSLVISIVAVTEALSNPGGHIVIVGPTDRQSGELFQKILHHVKNAPIGSEVESSTQRQMIMKNGCRISSFPTGDTGDTIRGMTANTLIMEEAAFIKDDIINQVLLPMVAATNGKVIKISTPFGMNHFYKSFQEDANYISHHNTWKDAVAVGLFSQEFIDEQRKQCTSMEFKTEYEAEFIADEDAYFGHELIGSCIAEYQMLSEV